MIGLEEYEIVEFRDLQDTITKDQLIKFLISSKILSSSI
jgi:hypothetical protein